MNKTLKSGLQIKKSTSRRSLRRINKLLEKNLSQYRIPNPYRTSRYDSCLPQNLVKQLSKLDYLSVRCLQNVHLKQPSVHQQMNQLLIKMRLAAQKQSDQLNIIVNTMLQRSKKMSQKTLMELDKRSQNVQDDNQLNNSAFLPKDSNNYIELQIQHNQQSVSHPSQRVIIMSDNYEADKQLSNGHRHFFIGHRHFELELEPQEQIQPYQI